MATNDNSCDKEFRSGKLRITQLTVGSAREGYAKERSRHFTFQNIISPPEFVISFCASRRWRPAPLSCRFLSTSSSRCREGGSSIYDIPNISGFFDLLPLCPHLELIYMIKLSQPPLLRPLFHDPLPPLMRTSYLEAPSSAAGEGGG